MRIPGGDNQNAKLAELNSGCLGGNTVDYKKRWTANCNVCTITVLSAPLSCTLLGVVIEIAG